ncbi:hypothetical protein H8E77_42125 [bacterium]|nr:hypothetical protein [bacterium]
MQKRQRINNGKTARGQLAVSPSFRLAILTSDPFGALAMAKLNRITKYELRVTN